MFGANRRAIGYYQGMCGYHCCILRAIVLCWVLWFISTVARGNNWSTPSFGSSNSTFWYCKSYSSGTGCSRYFHPRDLWALPLKCMVSVFLNTSEHCSKKQKKRLQHSDFSFFFFHPKYIILAFVYDIYIFFWDIQRFPILCTEIQLFCICLLLSMHMTLYFLSQKLWIYSSLPCKHRRCSPLAARLCANSRVSASLVLMPWLCSHLPVSPVASYFPSVSLAGWHLVSWSPTVWTSWPQM